VANLQLTEDLAFGCYLYALADGNYRTGYVPDAFFNYDVETKPEKYLKQRRRWMNGLVAGMNHLLFKLLFTRHERPLPQRILLALVFVFQYHFSMQFLILPAFYMCAAYSMLGGFHTDPSSELYMVNAIKPTRPWIPPAGAFAFWAFLAAWAVTHHRRAYVGWLYHLVLALVMVGGGLLGGGSMVIWRVSPAGDAWGGGGADGWGPAAAAMGAVCAAVPVLSAAAALDPRGLRVSVVNSFLQLWFMPMYIFTGAYAMARFGDITWGNRPHQSASQDGAKRDECMRRCRRAGHLVVAAYLLANAAVGTLLILLGHFRWLGVDPFMVSTVVIIAPVALSSIFGLSFTTCYMARYRWAPWIRSRASRVMQAQRAAAGKLPARDAGLAEPLISEA